MAMLAMLATLPIYLRLPYPIFRGFLIKIAKIAKIATPVRVGNLGWGLAILKLVTCYCDG